MTFKFLRFFFIFLLIFTWVFSGWPKVWQIPQFPPRIETTYALTATYSIPWATDLEGFSWVSETCSGGATCTQNFTATDGNPAGSVFTKVVGKNKKNLGYWKKQLTWEQMGVPAGSAVTAVDGKFDVKLVQETHASVQAIGLKLFDSADSVSIATGGVDIETEFDSTSASWVTRNTDGAKNIDTAYQPSNATVTIRMREDVNSGNNNSASTEVRVDNVVFTITYVSAVVSVSVSDGVVSYGTMPANTSKSTLSGELNDIQIATNNGNVTENFNIKGQNTACPWTLAASSGSEQYTHQFCNDTDLDCSSPPTNYTALTTGYQALDTGIAASGTVDFQLRITTPTNTSCFSQQSVDVTIQAVQQ